MDNQERGERMGSTSSNAAASRRAVERQLVEKCWKDPAFKAAVVADPKGMLERQTGHALPDRVKIFIHEEDANTLHLSIPPAPSNVSELSDEELSQVAGGTDVFAITLLIGTVGVGVGVTAGAVAGKVAGGW
jgi:hypothetical protein